MSLSEVKIASSINELIAFKKSIIWKDIIRELYSWRRGFENELKAIVDNAATSNPSTASVLMHLGDLNGRIKAVDYMIKLPDIFIGILEQEQEQKQSNQPEEEIEDGSEE
jgi:hypothetical protein